MSAEDFAGEAEAEADAVGAVATARGIAAVKTFEDTRAVVGGNARAGVGDGDERVRGGGGEGEAHATFGVVKLEGVGGEILERLFKEDGVGGNRDMRWQDGIELKVGREGGAVFDDVGEERAEIGGRAVEGQASAVGEGEEQEFFEDGFEAMNLVEEARVDLLLRRTGGRRAEGLLELGLEEGEGSFELVGSVGAEAARLMKTSFEAVEHGVEDGDEALEFAVVGGSGDALVEALGGDAFGGAGERGDRAQRARSKPPGAGADDEQDEREGGEVAAAELTEIGVEFVKVGGNDEGSVRIAGDGDAPRAVTSAHGGVGGLANGEAGIARGESAAAGRRWRAVEGDSAFVGAGHGEGVGGKAVGPTAGAELDAIVVFYPERVGGWAVAAGDEGEGGIEARPVAGVVDAVEVGLGEVVKLAVEAFEIEARGDGPCGEAGGEEERGGEQTDEEREAETKRIHDGGAEGEGSARAR